MKFPLYVTKYAGECYVKYQGKCISLCCETHIFLNFIDSQSSDLIPNQRSFVTITIIVVSIKFNKVHKDRYRSFRSSYIHPLQPQYNVQRVKTCLYANFHYNNKWYLVLNQALCEHSRASSLSCVNFANGIYAKRCLLQRHVLTIK